MDWLSENTRQWSFLGPIKHWKTCKTEIHSWGCAIRSGRDSHLVWCPWQPSADCSSLIEAKPGYAPHTTIAKAACLIGQNSLVFYGYYGRWSRYVFLLFINFCVHVLQKLYQQYDIVRKSANLASGCPPKNLGHKMHKTQPLVLLFFSWGVTNKAKKVQNRFVAECFGLFLAATALFFLWLIVMDPHNLH